MEKRDRTPECQRLSIPCFTKNRPFSCNFCQLRFTQTGSLNRHMKLHLGYRDHSCKLCMRRFTTMWNLKQHQLRVHNRTVPALKCEKCSRNFRFKNDLVEHTRTHTKERPFNCKVCGRNFRQKSHLWTHISTVHSTFRCSNCTQYIQQKDRRGFFTHSAMCG